MHYNIIDLTVLYMELFRGALFNNPPPKAYLQLTLNCTCKCKMCNFWKNSNYIDPPLLLVKNIVLALERIEVRRICLWGGEPYLYKHLVEIISFIKDKRMECYIITNGTAFDENTLDASVKLLDEITFSIDSSSSDVHDKIRGRTGALDSCLSNLDRVVKLRGQKDKPYITIDSTLQKDNIRHIEDMLALSKKYNAALSIDPVQLNGYGNEGEVSLLDIPHETIREKMALLKKYSKKTSRMNSRSQIGLMEDYFMNRQLKIACFFPYIGMLLDPYGNVKLCWGWDKTIGNILDEDFLRKWRSKEQGQLRKKIIQNKIERCRRCNFYLTRWPEKTGHYALKSLFILRNFLNKY